MTGTSTLDQYILAHISEEDSVLRELDRETNLKVLGARMLSGHLQGQILSMISQMIKPRNILEIGTFTGYSAICLAKGLQAGGKLHTIEIDDELAAISGKYFAKAGLTETIVPHIGDACQIIPTLNLPFDLVFIDGDKRQYSAYFELAFPKVPIGSYFIADNILWSGKVVEELKRGDDQTQGILEFNDQIKNDPRVEKVILPIRDGMTLIRKISE